MFIVSISQQITQNFSSNVVSSEIRSNEIIYFDFIDLILSRLSGQKNLLIAHRSSKSFTLDFFTLNTTFFNSQQLLTFFRQMTAFAVIQLMAIPTTSLHEIGTICFISNFVWFRSSGSFAFFHNQIVFNLRTERFFIVWFNSSFIVIKKVLEFSNMKFSRKKHAAQKMKKELKKNFFKINIEKKNESTKIFFCFQRFQ